MITANQWYNIAQTAQVGTKSGIRIDFGTKYALFKVSVDYGNAVIAAVESNITAEETRLSVRIRYNNSAWFVDVRFSVSQETTLSAATYDNTGWEAVSPNTSVAGNTICIINDLTSLIRPSGGGESLFELMNVGTAEVPRFAVVPKKYNGVEVGIISNTFISMAGFEEPDDDTPVASSSLGDLLDVQITDPKSKDVLTYDEDLRKWVNGPGGLDETALGNYLTTNKYITQDALTGALNGYVTNEIYNTAITALNLRLTELETVFKEWFYYDDVNKAIRTKLSLIVDGTLSMGELGSSGGTEVASGKLADLLDVQITDPASGQILLYNEEKGLWVNGSAGLNEEQLEAYLKGKDYATNSALSSLQTSVNTLRTDFDNLNTLLNGNVGGIIDTWNEVVSFLDGYSQSDDLASILSGMNSDIANRVLIEDFEELEGSVTDISNRVKTFEDVIGIDSNGDVYIKGTHNFYTAGGTISMFGLGEGDSGEVTSVSIKFEGSDVLYNPINGVITLPAYPSAGGGVADSVAWSNVTGKPNFATVATSGKYSDLSGVPTALPASDVYSWAKAASKPTYAFSEITSKPTTLAGYGITDATHYFKGDGYATSKVANGNIVQYGDGAEWRLTDNLWSVEYVILHHRNYASYALPLSGGTISGPLTVNNDFYTNNVRFNREGVTQILTAYAGLNYDLSYYDGSTWERVLTSKNYSNYALPLSGGTVYGSVVTKATPGLKIEREGNDVPYIRFERLNGEDVYGELGVTAGGNLAYFPLKTSVGGYGNWNTVIHSGILSAYLPDWVEKATLSDAINTLEVGTSDPDLGDYYIAQYAGGNSIGNYTYYRRPLSALYNRFVNSLDKRYLSLSGGEMEGVITMPVYYQIQWGDTSRMIYGDVDTIKMFAPSGVYIDGWLAVTYGNIGKALTSYNADAVYDYQYISIAGGSGLPTEAQYGSLLTLPYRSLTNNAKPDYAAQIFIPNGDSVTPYMWFRTSLSNSYNPWRKIVSEETDGKVWHNNVVEINRPDSSYDTMFFTKRSDYNWRIGFGIGTSLNRGIYDTDKGWILKIYNGVYSLLAHTVEGDLTVTGTLAMGTLSSSSDARLKDNIELLTDNESLSVLRRLKPSKWNWKSNGALSYGFIAQEVESVASCMVDRMNDEELGQKLYLQYNQLHAFEVGAIQHIDSEVEQLNRDLNTANLRIEKLENELKQYRLCQ